jgi:hypothetical protein
MRAKETFRDFINESERVFPNYWEGTDLERATGDWVGKAHNNMMSDNYLVAIFPGDPLFGWLERNTKKLMDLWKVREIGGQLREINFEVRRTLNELGVERAFTRQLTVFGAEKEGKPFFIIKPSHEEIFRELVKIEEDPTEWAFGDW